MRKKLNTRFSAARIKKIMQTDEDVGKIALAVPVLVSKALELFLQELCDRTHNITLQRGTKTISSLHLKQCVHSFVVYDFLREVVSKIPDMGGHDAGAEERSRKRKVCDGYESGDELKRTRHDVTGHPGTASGRRKGRGRSRRGYRGAKRDGYCYDKYEDDPGASPQHNDGLADEHQCPKSGNERNIELNVDLGGSAAGPSAVAPDLSNTVAPIALAASEANHEAKHDDYPAAQ